MEEGGALKGSGQELGACGEVLLLMEGEISVGVALSDVTLCKWLGMINELEYRRS